MMMVAPVVLIGIAGFWVLACTGPAEHLSMSIHRAAVDGSTGLGAADGLIDTDEAREDTTEAGEVADELVDSVGDIADSLDHQDIAIVDLLDAQDIDEPPSPCPAEMVPIGETCMDRYEAPNTTGELPFVMFTFYEAERWCAARDKRLCFDDEWTSACAGDAGLAYPYGNVRVPGRCNDAKTWRTYTQSLLNGWPNNLPIETIATLPELMETVRARGPNASNAADHVMALYQAGVPGDYPGCVGEAGVYDLVGSIEEWTRRRDGGNGVDFSGALKGRYWAESRTCQSRVTTHGNAFRFYEIGFRCCRDIVSP